MQARIKLDKLDYRILYLLDCDAGQSFAEIGKKLGVGRDVILYRVKRLEELGVIKKYVSLIDYGKLGFLVGALYVKFQHETPQLRNDIMRYYHDMPAVWWLLDMTPNYDFAFGWFGRDLHELKKMKIEILKRYRKYFKDFRFRVYNKQLHFNRSYLAHEGDMDHEQIEIRETPVTIVAATEKLTDAIDDAILAVLAENARKPYVEIANQLGLSAAQVHYRIAQLKKNGILLGARAMLDLEKLGIDFFKLDIHLDDYSVYEQVVRFCHSLPNVVYSYDVIGGADIELDLEVKDYTEFSNLVDAIKAKFGPAISHTEAYQFKKEHKLIYLPQIFTINNIENKGEIKP
jgi:DNA-binding Lrp family transcriptional regulator